MQSIASRTLNGACGTYVKISDATDSVLERALELKQVMVSSRKPRKCRTLEDLFITSTSRSGGLGGFGGFLAGLD